MRESNKSFVEITLLPSGSQVSIDASLALGPALKAQGYAVHSGCAGYGYCADCLVTIVEQPENAFPPTYDERRMIGALFHGPRYRDPQPLRLACQLKLHGPVTIDISRHLDAKLPSEHQAPATLISASSIVRRPKA